MYTFTALALLSVVAANPLASRATCRPNFEGSAVSVGISTFEWGVPTVAASTRLVATAVSVNGANDEWLFQNDGASPASYIVKAAANTGLLVSETQPAGTLALVTAPATVTDPKHLWDVECTFCESSISTKHGVVASGCTIRTRFNGGNLCVQQENVNPAPQFVGLCVAGQANQIFQFTKV